MGSSEERRTAPRSPSSPSSPTSAGPTATPGTRLYVVQPGETIYDIARTELGSAVHWTDIYRLNRDALGPEADRVTPGMRLLLPQESGGSGVLTQRPGTGTVR